MTQSKSEKSDKSEHCSVEVETDDDLLDLDLGPTAEVESDAELVKAPTRTLWRRRLRPAAQRLARDRPRLLQLPRTRTG